MALTRRLGGAKPRFAELLRHLPRGAEVGLILDDLLNRLQSVTRGLPTKHADTHKPTSGDDPLATGTPLDIGTTNLAGTSDNFAHGAHSHRLGIVTTKGDLIVSDGSNPVRFPVGADDSVLTADSSEATGMRWVPPPPPTPESERELDDYVLYATTSARYALSQIVYQNFR